MSAATTRGAGPTARANAPGRSRSAQADAAILDATLAVLDDVGYGAMTTAAVIELAGVSSATLYRRYASKQELVVAALSSVTPEPVDADTGSLAGDLAALVADVAHSAAARQGSGIERLSFEISRDPELAATLREKYLQPRRDQLALILDRAVARGEIATAPPADLAVSLVVGPLYHRAFVARESMSPRFTGAVVDFACRGLGLGGPTPTQSARRR